MANSATASNPHVPSLILSPSVTPRMISPNTGEAAYRRSSKWRRPKIPESSPEEPETTLRIGNLPPTSDEGGDYTRSPRPASIESSGTDTIQPSPRTPRSEAKSQSRPRDHSREVADRVSFAASPPNNSEKRTTSIMRSPRTPRTPRTPRSPGRGHGDSWTSKVSHIDLAVRRQIASQILARCQDLKDMSGCRAVFQAWKNECDLGKFYNNMIRIAAVRRKRRRVESSFEGWRQIVCQTNHLLMVHSSLISKTEFNLVSHAMEAWCEIKLRLDRFSQMIWKSSMVCLGEVFNGWADRTARIARFRRQIWAMNGRIMERTLVGVFDAWRDACGNCDIMSLDILDSIFQRKRMFLLLPVLHAWGEYVSRQRILERVAHNCSHRWSKLLERQAFWEWSFISIDVDQDRVWNLKADKKRMRSLSRQSLSMWSVNARKAAVQQSRLVRAREKMQSRGLRWGLNTFISNSWRNRQLRASLACVMDRHIRRVMLGVFRSWYYCMFDLRMESRSENMKSMNEARLTNSFLRVWRERHEFWKRVQAVCLQLQARHIRKLRMICMSTWKMSSDRYWSRWRRMQKLQRNHSALLVQTAFSRWMQTVAPPDDARAQAVEELCQTRELRLRALMFGEWAWIVRLATAVARRYAHAHAMLARDALQAWMDTAVQAGERDHRLVQLEQRSTLRLLHDTFLAWLEAKEYYYRLSGALDAVLRRVERRSTALMFYAWHWCVARAKRRHVIFQQMCTRLEFFAKLSCFHVWKTRAVDPPVRRSGLSTLLRRVERAVQQRALGGWRGHARFKVRAERIIAGFWCRHDLQYVVLAAWKDAHRVRLKIKIHGLHWNRKDGERALCGWRDLTQRSAEAKELHIHALIRSLAVFFQGWTRAVDLRKSLRLRYAWMRMRHRKEAILLLRAFSEMVAQVQRRVKVAQVQRSIGRRVDRRVLTRWFRTWQAEVFEELRYANALNKFATWRVHNLRRWGLQRWKQWLDHKWRTQHAFSRVMDEI